MKEWEQERERERERQSTCQSTYYWYQQIAGGETSWYFCLTVQLPSPTLLLQSGPSVGSHVSVRELFSACLCVRVCTCVLVKDSISQRVAGRPVIWGSVSPRRWLSELSETLVCSSPRCSSPCLYLQLFSPLSVNILLTTLHTEEAGRVNKSHYKDVRICWRWESRTKHWFIISTDVLSNDKTCTHWNKSIPKYYEVTINC